MAAPYKVLDKGESANFRYIGPRAYLQSIHREISWLTRRGREAALTCSDGAFIRDEANITASLQPLRALLIDLPAVVVFREMMMSKKSAKKRQPVKPVVAKEPARTAKNFGYEEMLSELEAIVADAETRLAEDEATA